jgi:hypothetical protein
MRPSRTLPAKRLPPLRSEPHPIANTAYLYAVSVPRRCLATFRLDLPRDIPPIGDWQGYFNPAWIDARGFQSMPKSVEGICERPSVRFGTRKWHVV